MSDADSKTPATSKANDEPVPQQPTLSEVIGAILCDVARAQNQSNQYTKKIAEKYVEDEVLRSFPVPNGLFDELEMNFKMALSQVFPYPAKDKDRKDAIIQSIRQVAPHMASEILEAAAKWMKGSVDTTNKAEKDFHASLTGPGWQSYLAREIMKEVVKVLRGVSLDEVVEEAARKGLDDSILLGPLEEVVKRNIPKHPDLGNIIRRARKSKTSRGDLKDMLGDALDEIMNVLWGAVNAGLEATEPPALFGNIDSVRLEDTDALANIRLKVAMRGYRWLITVEKDSHGTPYIANKELVPEDQ